MQFLTPADLRGMTSQALGDLLERRDLLVAAIVAAGEGEVGGPGAAALLFADFSVLRQDATLILEDATTWAGVTWRIGRSALSLCLQGRPILPAHEAKALGLCDDVIDADAATWFEGWSAYRSQLALDTAATLIRGRGGDALERAAFARLFALGEPQKGLAAFLEKRPASF